MTYHCLFVSEASLDDKLLKQSRYSLEFDKLQILNSKVWCEDKMTYLDLHIYQSMCESLVNFHITKTCPADLAHYKGLVTDFAINLFWSLEECRQHKRQKIYFMYYLPVRREGYLDRAKEAVKLLNNPNAQIPLLDLHKYSEIMVAKLYQINYR